jgi:hypothetical protein
MKSLVQKVCFIYGCFAFAGSALWFWISCTTTVTIPANPRLILSLFGLHGLILCLTFQRFIGLKPFWAPIWEVSKERLRWARRAIVSFLALSIGIIAFMFLTARLHNRILVEKSLNLFLPSLGMLSSLYIALHWAFRPENLFNKEFLRFMTNPLGYIWMWLSSQRRRR